MWQHRVWSRSRNKFKGSRRYKRIKRNFIYVLPNDKKLIDSDTQILEFDAESKNIVIDKMNEVKNSKAFCFNKTKHNIYLLN